MIIRIEQRYAVAYSIFATSRSKWICNNINVDVSASVPVLGVCSDPPGGQ